MIIINKKLRRHDGRATPRLVKGIDKQYVLHHCIEPGEYWDDWIDYRDGFRGYDDRTKLRYKDCINNDYLKVTKWNSKIKVKNIIRNKRKKSLRNIDDSKV